MRYAILALWLAGAAFLQAAPQWIWSDAADPAPKNRFTYFRKVVTLPEVPQDATLLVAADSNAWVWINGEVVRRKMTRFHERLITAEAIDARPFLHAGRNTVVVLHHNWGDVVTFQRDANKHAGLWVAASWIESDASWHSLTAPEFLAHEKRITGFNARYPRIRYPVVLDARRRVAGDVFSAEFDEAGWKPAVVVTNGPWPATPARIETPAQREYAVEPLAVLASGTIEAAQPLSEDPASIAKGMRTAKYRPDPAADTRTLRGRAGETRYITFDFRRPVHGYPFLELDDAPPGTTIDFGYGELAYAQYNGEMHVAANGWLDPEGVVGTGYGDRYVTTRGAQKMALPDERTARWMTVHVHFSTDGAVRIRRLGIVKSQYPVEWLGSFSCGDERIDQIVKLCLIHAEITMSDCYVDTPGREDGEWIEDARQRAVIASRWFGDARLRRLMIRHHAESQGAGGGFHAFPPSNYPAFPATFDWAVQWTAMLYDDYLWTADKEFLRRYWPNLQRFWSGVLEHLGEDGVWRARRVMADIGMGVRLQNETQSSGVVTPFMIDRLRWSATLAGALGERAQQRNWLEAADRMAQAFRKFHVVPASDGVPAHVGDRLDTAHPDLPRGYSQAAQVNAVLAGLFTREEALATIHYAFPAPDGTPPAGIPRWNNPTFAYRALRALSDCGLTDRAVAHLIERYAPYLPGNPRNRVPAELQGPYGGPLPEYWVSREDLGLPPGQRNPAQPRDETGSHGWGAVPLLWLHDTLLGVTIAEPGGAKLRIAPQTGGLPFVAGHTMTPKGLVWVSWHPRENRLELRLPPEVAAEVVLPGRTVRLDHGGEYVLRGE